MADTVYLSLRRNDIPQGSLQITDLRPNTSQRNLIYEPVGQTGYVIPTHTPQNGAITALVASDPDGSGGNTHLSTAATEYGLQAYLRDRVNANPGAANTSLSVAQAATAANAIVDRMSAAQSITITDINTILTAAVGAATDLDGATVGGSISFGRVEEVLRILAGQVYRVNANTVVETIAGPTFISLAARIAAIGANTANFSPAGVFAATTDSDYRDFRQLYQTGALHISLGEGVLSKLVDPLWVWLNPSFYYGGVAVTGKTRATTLKASAVQNIPLTGAAAAVVVYDNAGNVL